MSHTTNGSLWGPCSEIGQKVWWWNIIVIVVSVWETGKEETCQSYIKDVHSRYRLWARGRGGLPAPHCLPNRPDWADLTPAFDSRFSSEQMALAWHPSHGPAGEPRSWSVDLDEKEDEDQERQVLGRPWGEGWGEGDLEEGHGSRPQGGGQGSGQVEAHWPRPWIILIEA